MIRINLLPQKRNRRQEAVRGEMTLVGLGAAILIAALLVVHVLYSLQQRSIATGNVELQQKIEQKQEIVNEIEEARQAKADLERRLEVIKRLKANKSGPVRMLDELALATPEKLQLTSLTERDKLIQITGVSINHELISRFLSNLEESAYFSDVLLIGSDSTEVDGVQLKSFSITSRLVVPGVESGETSEAAATPGAGSE